MTALRKSIQIRRRGAGFTVVELAVSLLVLVVVLLGMLALFDFSNRLSHVQTNVADMQQSQRIAQQDAMRMIRMLGRGPIPLGPATNGVSLAVWDQVPVDTHIDGDDDNDLTAVLPGTDIVTIRGVFSSPVYQVNALASGSFEIHPENGGFKGHVDISNMTPTLIPQDLQALIEAVENGTRERLVLVNARNLDQWSIVELKAGSADLTAAHLEFESLPTTGEPPAHFTLSTGDPLGGLTAVAFVGILEEHRFYIRQTLRTAINGTQDLVGQFSRARVVPGTDDPWGGDSDNLHIDIADNIVDLQVALGFDTSNGGGRISDDADNIGDDDRIYESADGNDDDWLYNSDQAVNPLDWDSQKLYFVRLTTLARTDRRDAWYKAPSLVRLENHDLTGSRFNSEGDRMFRYRPLQTYIDLRNVN